MSVLKDRVLIASLLSGLLVAGGCRQSATPVRNADGTLTNPNGSVTVPAQSAQAPQPVQNSDGSVTNPDGSVTYPANSTMAAREKQQVQPNGPPPAPGAGNVVASNVAAPQSAPVVTAPVSVTAPAGTAVTVRLNSGLAASRNEVGDRFSGVLERSVTGRGGQVVFERGTPVSGEVVASKGKGRFKGAGDLGIELTAIGRSRVETSEYERVSPGRGKRTAGFAGGGAGVGALIGGLAGGGKGALIGGLTGAGAGTAAGAYTGSRDVVIPAESVVTFRLNASVTR